jgi:hypothetical protein
MYHASYLIASSGSSFSLNNDSGTIGISFMNDCDIDALLMQLRTEGFRSGNGLTLHFEHIRGNALLPVIDIYLNLEQKNKPEKRNYVGAMALYGIGESSEESTEHDGAGQDRVFDVGPVFSRVRNQSNWSKAQFNLTLIYYKSLPAGATLTIGRIALNYYEK